MSGGLGWVRACLVTVAKGRYDQTWALLMTIGQLLTDRAA